jgi:hypothetical protein
MLKVVRTHEMHVAKATDPADLAACYELLARSQVFSPTKFTQREGGLVCLSH